MVNNPHQLLGVPENATQEEIKRAYRRKAKECHPDLHPNDPDAARKMNELNEAYDMLMNPDKYARRQQQNPYGQQGNPYSGNPYGGNPYGGNPYGGNPYGQSRQQGNPYGQQGAGGWQADFGGFGFEDLFGFGTWQQVNVPPPTEQPGDPALVRQAIRAINQRQFQAAIAHLQQVVSTQRNARWYYLSGVAHHGAGNSIQAVEHMTRACQMAPDNQVYQQLLRQYRRAGQTYQQYAGNRGAGGFDPMRLCYLCCMMQVCCSSRGWFFCI